MTVDPSYLDRMFGPGEGLDPRLRAQGSRVSYVRSIDQIALEHSERATGRRLTSFEALEAYGLEILMRVADEGSALISHSTDAAGRTLKARREQLGVSIRNVAGASGLSVGVVEALEESRMRPVREYERVARLLALDEDQLSFRPAPTKNENIAVRLRTMADDRASLTPSSVVAIAEATWVAAKQLYLESLLGLKNQDVREFLAPSADFGGNRRAPYAVGYELAQKLRQFLDLGEDPVLSMRELAEDRLGVPVIMSILDPTIAGVTVEVAGGRAIILNLAGANINPLVRRATVAHEICHLLFDVSGDLQDLRVDRYDDLERNPAQGFDKVEQRANAFAAEFLAPQESAVLRYLETDQNLNDGVVDYFGIGFTAGRFQVWNGLRRPGSLESISGVRLTPEDDWEGRESFTASYHPLEALLNHPSRAGKFSALTIRAAENGLISWDTASEWLWSPIPDVRKSGPWMRDLYPKVFGHS